MPVGITEIVSLLWFIGSKIFDAEDDPKLETGEDKHSFVKSETLKQAASEEVKGQIDNLIIGQVKLLNKNNALSERGAQHVRRRPHR